MTNVSDATRCIHRPAIVTEGYASLAVPTHRASTIAFPDGNAYARRKERGPDGYSYGLAGTPTTRTLEAQIAALEGANRTAVTPSGLAAVTLAMLAVLRPGDELLAPDTVYPPVRDFVAGHLAEFGVSARYYDPLVGAGIATLLSGRTRLVWTESPGSTTMEVQDLPAIAAVAHARGALVGCDNSWATPLLFKPLAHGADISVEAVTKYMSGHSDVLMGSIATNDPALHAKIRTVIRHLGIGVSPDDCSLALRGLETLDVRLERSARTAMDLAKWLQGWPEVERVLHPALPDCPGHSVWARDFAGASGTFSVLFRQGYAEQVTTALSALRLFAIGASWGGTRSLVAPMAVRPFRTATAWTAPDPVLRISVGLEHPDDLRADLDAFAAVLRRVRRPPGPARAAAE